MEMMLQTQNLCKYFKKQKAVNNVSLNIEKGQIYGLLGPNGAGKSTTLKMLTGMMKPTAGKIYFDGKLLDRKDLSKIGALIENPPIYENLSARENLKVRQLLLGTDENRIDDTRSYLHPCRIYTAFIGAFAITPHCIDILASFRFTHDVPEKRSK